MLKKGIILFFIISLQFIFASNLSAQSEIKEPEINEETAAEEKKEAVKEEINITAKEDMPGSKEKARQKVTGKITEIAADDTYLKIGDKKIITDKVFLNDSFIAMGDNVEIIAEETEEGLKALDYKYIYEEGSDTSGLDEDLSAPDEFDLDLSGER
ncbi:MAG: hypothetical protein AB1498_02520 [bacterium]